MFRPTGKTAAISAASLLIALFIAFHLTAEDSGGKSGSLVSEKEQDAHPTAAQKKNIKQLIKTIESRPSGVIIHNKAQVQSGVDHRPYNPDGSRNQNFRVLPDEESAKDTHKLDHQRKRGRAVKELIHIGRPAVPQVVPALMKEGHRFRHLYAYILGEIGDPRAVPALIKYMEDGVMKKSLAESYRRLDKKEMAGKLDKEGQGMVSDAAGALERISGEDYGPDLSKWKKWWKKNKHKYGPPIPIMQYTANPPESSGNNP